MTFRKPSTIALLVCCVAIFFYQVIGQTNRTLTWDIFGYYLYLPSTFIFPHSGFGYYEWLQTIIAKYSPSTTLYQVFQLENGQWMIRYTMGIAILESPFFFIAHIIAPLLDYPQDGFSYPYQFCIAFGTLIYSFIGLFFLRKILLRFFSEKITSITLLLLVFATNYMQLAAEGSALTHGPLFCIVSLVLWFTIKWHETPKLKYALSIGLLTGLALIIRPPEVLVAVIPLLWSIKDKISLKEKIQLLKNHFPHLIMAIIIVLFCAFPQSLFWHSKSGEWIFNSYSGNAGEGLDLYKPHLFNFLFSFRKGWFIYTPVMLFAVAGFIYLYRNNKAAFIPLIVFFLLTLWVVSCWTIWWYGGGSYSPRAIMPIYAAMAIPLGYSIENIANKKKLKNVWWTILVLLTIFNLFQNWQYVAGIISKERMSFKYYARVFGKTTVTEEDKKLLLPDRTDDIFHKDGKFTLKNLGIWDFEESSNDSTVSYSGKKSFRMDSMIQFSPGIKMSYAKPTSKDYAWIRASVKVWIPANYNESSPALVITFNHDGKSYKYRAKELKSEEIKKEAWNDLKADYITPDVRSTGDIVQVYVWQKGKEAVYIDELKVDLWEPEE